MCSSNDGNRHQPSKANSFGTHASTALPASATIFILTHCVALGEGNVESHHRANQRPAQKLDSKLGVRANQFRNPSFMLSLETVCLKKFRPVLAVRWNVVRQFSMRVLMTTAQTSARCACDPFAFLAYHLKRMKIFTTAE